MPPTIESLRRTVLAANVAIARRGLAPFTFGNVSGIDRARGLVVIKPSGVPYDRLRPESMVITDLDGVVKRGKLRPSSDLPTHLVLYRAFAGIGAVVHTHSPNGTSWAQAGREIPCLGTTHADYFRGPIPVTEQLAGVEIDGDYEANTGHLIVRRFRSLDPMQVPAVLVHGHGSFCWGRSAAEAVETAAVLEMVAKMALDTIALNPGVAAIPDRLLDRHFLRKHGTAAYYGQGAAPVARKRK